MMITLEARFAGEHGRGVGGGSELPLLIWRVPTARGPANQRRHPARDQRRPPSGPPGTGGGGPSDGIRLALREHAPVISVTTARSDALEVCRSLRRYQAISS